MPALKATYLLFSITLLVLTINIKSNSVFATEDEKSIDILAPMPRQSLSNDEIVNGSSEKGQTLGVLDDATNLVKEKVNSMLPGQSVTVKTSTVDLDASTNKSKILAGKILSRLTKILAKEEILVTEKKTLGFASTQLDEKVTKIKQDIDAASTKINGLTIDPAATDKEQEKTKLRSVIADVKAALQLVKDDERDLLSSL